MYDLGERIEGLFSFLRRLSGAKRQNERAIIPGIQEDPADAREADDSRDKPGGKSFYKLF
jgi:hypothetical protein